MLHCQTSSSPVTLQSILQVATDALTAMEKAMARDKIHTNDRQLACARINSQEGQDYLKAMACAANFAWVNRSSMTFLVRQAFAKMFHTTPDDLDMHLVYDVSHNIAKVGAYACEISPVSLYMRWCMTAESRVAKTLTQGWVPHVCNLCLFTVAVLRSDGMQAGLCKALLCM